MQMLHDPAVRSALEARLATLRPDSPRQWGTMDVGQMLWHVNQFLGAAVGEGTLMTQKPPMPPALLRFFVIYAPWPKGSPTNNSAIPTGEHNFEMERARCKELIAKFVTRPIDGEWPVNPSFGAVTGKFESKLQAKHLDHHFKQFKA